MVGCRQGYVRDLISSHKSYHTSSIQHQPPSPVVIASHQQTQETSQNKTKTGSRLTGAPARDARTETKPQQPITHLRYYMLLLGRVGSEILGTGAACTGIAPLRSQRCNHTYDIYALRYAGVHTEVGARRRSNSGIKAHSNRYECTGGRASHGDRTTHIIE